MSLLARWRAYLARWREALLFEARWTVTADHEALAVVDTEGTVARIGFADFDAIVVETNDTGPWGADV